MADLSINEQSNATTSISSASLGGAVKANHSDSANKVDSSSELAQILGSLQNSLDLEDDYNEDYKDSLDLANKLLSDSIDSKNVEIKDLQKNVMLLSKKISENPAEYIPSLCVEGKISEEKLSAFLKTQIASIQQQLKDLISVPSNETTTTTTTTTTTENDSDSRYEHSDSYLYMAKVTTDLAATTGCLERKLSDSLTLQTDMNSTLSGTLVDSSTNAVIEAQKEADRIERLIARQKKKAKQNAIIGHVISGVSVALACCTMNPVLIGMTVALVADQEIASGTGRKSGMDHITGGLASGLEKAGMTPKAAKLVADITVTVAVAAAAAGGAGAAAAGKTAATEGAAVAGAEAGGEVGAHAGAQAGANASAQASANAGAEAGAQNATTSASRTASIIPMAAVIGSMVASSTKMYSDMAEAIIAGENIDSDSEFASQIRMGVEIGGAVLSMAACTSTSLAFGMESLAGVTLEGNALLLQQLSMALLVSMEVAANATSSALSYELGAIELGITHSERSLSEIMAYMEMNNAVSDQLSSLTDTVINGYNSEISNLGSSLNSLLSETGRLNVSTVTYA